MTKLMPPPLPQKYERESRIALNTALEIDDYITGRHKKIISIKNNNSFFHTMCLVQLLEDLSMPKISKDLIEKFSEHSIPYYMFNCKTGHQYCAFAEAISELEKIEIKTDEMMDGNPVAVLDYKTIAGMMYNIKKELSEIESYNPKNNDNKKKLQYLEKFCLNFYTQLSRFTEESYDDNPWRL